ncbi:copper fist DNA binding domain-containing protein [Gilbertella persicaria]|uniref:copper fist DNA binding domain-containing protein n=1 Tax=Gilbertella persicaria TaxID=101096 RepID=UPI00222013BF|nr:copper fist DNA binding domain-containing protein [Gilbertella persicaria]KAI8047941.1 copper fist DNA binding domain-containing protein [Gilbertella persicaria]
MIIINNIKYACQKCIKGHRSSRCEHTERHLMVVRRKGRPVSQCEACRELRKVRQIHQKCHCSNKRNAPYIMSIEALLIPFFNN